MATQTRSKTSKRELVAPKGSKRYVRRNPQGQFKKEVQIAAGCDVHVRAHAREGNEADVELWQAMNLQSALPFLQQEQANEAARRQAAGQILASGLKNAGESIRASASAPAYPPQVHIPQMPRQYLSMNPITGTMETVTEYGNGVRNVSPVGQ